MIISCQAKTSRGASPQAKGHGRPGHRRPSSGLVLEMRRQLADSWQMRWRPSISAGVVQVSPFVLLFICDPDANPAWANLQELLGILKDPEPFLALLVWKFGPVAQWLAAGSEIGFALAAIPLAFMAAGLERCGRSEAQKVCPRSAEEPDLLFGQ